MSLLRCRRRALKGALFAALFAAAVPAPVFAQAAGEAALREAIGRFQAAWNARDLSAWEQLVTDDIQLQETYAHTSESRHINNRERSRPQFENRFETFDLDWVIQRIKMLPGGHASVLMTVRQHALPRAADGRYAASFTSDPAVTRWRLESGRWRMTHFVTHAGTAREIVAKEGL